MDNTVGENDKKLPMVLKLPYRKYGFFRDDQIVFLVSHAENRIEPPQLENFRVGINRLLEESKVGTIEDKPGSISATSFPALTPEQIEQCQQLLATSKGVTLTGAFSLITAKLTDAPQNPLDLMERIKDLRSHLKVVPDSGSDKDILKYDDKGDTYSVEVDEVKYDLRPGVSIASVTVEGASLNWLTSIVSQGAGTGGPGGVPTPYYGSRKNAPYTFEVKRRLQDYEIYGDGQDVDIAILDAAPSAHELVAAHKEWPDHPLIKDLLGLDGRLILYPLSYEETLRLANTSINGSDYKMTDHGLFIAGIIHSIVPGARIHLIEVLNQYGVGDLQAFNAGLEKALQLAEPGRKLFVNCSWMLDFPSDEQQCHHPQNAGGALNDPDLEFERQVLEFAKDDQMTLRLMKSLFTQFSIHHRGAVAAAGNDAYDNEKETNASTKHVRPLARYPAALTEVAGIGALPTTLDRDSHGKYQTSAFSNRSDRPTKVGIATLGGEEGEGKGVLGLYIGEFPDGRKNTSKWAWWAGTSFATPIITGVLASVYSGPKQPANVQKAIEILKDPNIKIIDGQTSLNEEVLPTTQC